MDIQTIKQRFGIIGNNAALQQDIEVAVQVAKTDLSVLITGESGVGKEHFPQIIHTNSSRRHESYFAINCGAIPESLIDSELFGHVKGSFTGAVSDHKGYFEVADKGTLFLDEVGELPLETQVRLLRVLETGEFLRVGDSKVLKTNVRVVAATNLDIPRAIEQGRFRADLYYRLNAIEIHVPALRERKEDIPLLFRKFAADFAAKYTMPVVRLTEDAKQLLMRYYWAGNIRQLKNVAEQVSTLAPEREVNAAMLSQYLPKNEMSGAPMLLRQKETFDRETFANERELLYKVLFEMKRDITDLRHQLAELTGKAPVQSGITPTAMSHTSMVEEPSMPIQKHTAEEHFSKEEYVVAEEYVENEEPSTKTAPTVATGANWQQVEKETIRRTLEKFGGSRKQTASELGISERTLYRKIKEYELDQK